MASASLLISPSNSASVHRLSRGAHAAAVQSIEPLVARLEKAGVQFTKSMSGRPAIFFRDPDANVLEVAESQVVDRRPIEPIDHWFDRRCERAVTGYVTTQELHKDYIDFCTRYKVTALGEKEFIKEFPTSAALCSQIRVDKRRVHKGMCFVGVRLREET